MSLSEAMSKRVERWANEVLYGMGRSGVALIHQLANVRVQRQASVVIRSDPGEPPRRDKSTLYKSIKFRVVRGPGKSADLEFYSTDNPIKLMSLEFGAEHMEARPLWAPARRMMANSKQVFKQRLNEKIKAFQSDPLGALRPGQYED